MNKVHISEEIKIKKQNIINKLEDLKIAGRWKFHDGTYERLIEVYYENSKPITALHQIDEEWEEITLEGFRGWVILVNGKSKDFEDADDVNTVASCLEKYFLPSIEEIEEKLEEA